MMNMTGQMFNMVQKDKSLSSRMYTAFSVFTVLQQETKKLKSVALILMCSIGNGLQHVSASSRLRGGYISPQKVAIFQMMYRV